MYEVLKLEYVRHVSESNSLDIPANCRVGTKRYLAPEVLDGSLQEDNFETYKQVWHVGIRIRLDPHSMCRTGAGSSLYKIKLQTGKMKIKISAAKSNIGMVNKD